LALSLELDELIRHRVRGFHAEYLTADANTAIVRSTSGSVVLSERLACYTEQLPFGRPFDAPRHLALALSDGRVAAFGVPDAVIDAPLIRTLYGIDVRFMETEGGTIITPASGTGRG